MRYPNVWEVNRGGPIVFNEYIGDNEDPIVGKIYTAGIRNQRLSSSIIVELAEVFGVHPDMIRSSIDGYSYTTGVVIRITKVTDNFVKFKVNYENLFMILKKRGVLLRIDNPDSNYPPKVGWTSEFSVAKNNLLCFEPKSVPVLPAIYNTDRNRNWTFLGYGRPLAYYYAPSGDPANVGLYMYPEEMWHGIRRTVKLFDRSFIPARAFEEFGEPPTSLYQALDWADSVSKWMLDTEHITFNHRRIVHASLFYMVEDEYVPRYKQMLIDQVITHSEDIYFNVPLGIAYEYTGIYNSNTFSMCNTDSVTSAQLKEYTKAVILGQLDILANFEVKYPEKTFTEELWHQLSGTSMDDRLPYVRNFKLSPAVLSMTCPICGQPIYRWKLQSGPLGKVLRKYEDGSMVITLVHKACVSTLPHYRDNPGLNAIYAFGASHSVLEEEGRMITAAQAQALGVDIEQPVEDALFPIQHNICNFDVLVSAEIVDRHSHQCSICGNPVILLGENDRKDYIRVYTRNKRGLIVICKDCKNNDNAFRTVSGRHQSSARNTPYPQYCDGECPGTPIYGIELEVDVNKVFIEEDVLHNRIINSHDSISAEAQRHGVLTALSNIMSRLGVEAEIDGSLSDAGIEFVWQPRTLKKWIEQLPEIEKFCKILNFYYYAGHDVNGTGLHVHASAAFDSIPIKFSRSVAIYFAQLLLAAYTKDVILFTRRSIDSLKQWASLWDLQNTIKDYLAGSNYPTCRAAISFGSTDKTFEYRMFRSTLKASTIVASIGLVDAIESFIMRNAQSWDDTLQRAIDTYDAVRVYSDGVLPYIFGLSDKDLVTKLRDSRDKMLLDKPVAMLFAMCYADVLRNWTNIQFVGNHDDNDDLQVLNKVITYQTKIKEGLGLPTNLQVGSNELELIKALDDFIHPEVKSIINNYVANIVTKYGQFVSTDYHEITA
jgi:hypothetical protein